MTENADIIENIKGLDRLHYSAGPIYKGAERLKALFYMPSDELRSIYHLVESHAPGLRYKATYRYEKNLNETDNKRLSINKQNIDFSCRSPDIQENIEKMLQQVEEMPKEWTIIQLTPKYNGKEMLETLQEKLYMNPLHVTVFNCGIKKSKPFCITVDAPIDEISGNVIEIMQEMSSIIADNKTNLKGVKPRDNKEYFSSYAEKHMYTKTRYTLNSRLKNLVKDIQDIWLKGWRCLFMGNLMDDKEQFITEKLDGLLKTFKIHPVSEKNSHILKCLFKSTGFLKISEIKNVLSYCYPGNKDLQINLAKSIYELGRQHGSFEYRRHPIILVIDEKLDQIPWEMLDILQEQPVSRMPCLHFTYALFKEHEESIIDGIKTDIDPMKGKYIINPGLDLKRMEMRLQNFFKFWTPSWDGLAGVAPTCEDFEEMLLNSDIFAYNGHGNGTQFFSSDNIQRLRINSVVFLFGCSSVKYSSLGPQVEMYGSNQMYFIACSPCIVGMLWEVTDFDTDLISTEVWSTWLPKTSELHWKNIDKKNWEVTGQIEPISGKPKKNIGVQNEPELLRALAKAKKEARQYLNQAACVARGIPVKIKC